MTNPHQFLIESQGIVDFNIKHFIHLGKFKHTEFDEIKQQINEELLTRIHKIRIQFQGRSLLRTYFSVIVKNVCNEIVRKGDRPDYVQLDEAKMNHASDETIYSLIFEEEILRLQKAVELYYKQKWKLLLCLKLRFKMPFNYEDFKNMNGNIAPSEFDWFVKQINPYQENTDTVVFSALTEVLNKHENKSNTPDALRKWIKLKINELIDILNGNPPTSNYREETLQILFEKCFHEEKEIMSKVF